MRVDKRISNKNKCESTGDLSLVLMKFISRNKRFIYITLNVMKSLL